MSPRPLLLAAVAIAVLLGPPLGSGLEAPFASGPAGLLRPFQVRPALATTPGRHPPAPPPIVEPRRPGALLFYFFSPDWRPPDLGKLAVSMEKALASQGVDISFQAFTRYRNFERQLQLQPPNFMMAPAWLEDPERGGPAGRFTVIARPLRREETTYRKALMTRSRIDSIDDLARGSVAATLHSMGAGRPEAILDAFHLTAGSVRVVPVPKDIDALLALNFGQVDAALVTSEHYETLAETNPAEAEKLRILAFSPAVRLPPVFAADSGGPGPGVRLGEALGRFGDSRRGRRVLAMLGLDGFVAEATAPEAAPSATEPSDTDDAASPTDSGASIETQDGVASSKPAKKKEAKVAPAP